MTTRVLNEDTHTPSFNLSVVNILLFLSGEITEEVKVGQEKVREVTRDHKISWRIAQGNEKFRENTRYQERLRNIKEGYENLRYITRAYEIKR